MGTTINSPNSGPDRETFGRAKFLTNSLNRSLWFTVRLPVVSKLHPAERLLCIVEPLGINISLGGKLRMKNLLRSLTALALATSGLLVAVALPASASTKVVTCFKLEKNVVHTKKFH